MLSYLRNSPSSLSPVPIFGPSLVMTDFAARRFLVFHDLLPIFIPKRYTFSIIMLMRQILLTIMHAGSVMPYVISGAVRKPGYVLTII